MSVIFRLGLDLPKCLLLSRIPTEIFWVFLIYPVRFSGHTCPTVFQFTTNHHSETSTNHAAPHSAMLFIPLPLPLTSHQISPSAYVLAWYFCVYYLELKHKHKHSPSNTLNSVSPIMHNHNLDLMCEIRVICTKNSVWYPRVQYPHISNRRQLLLKDKGVMYFGPYNYDY